MEIPREPLNISYSNNGFLPHVGLHCRGGMFYQESSYSHFLLGGVMAVAAILVSLLPLQTVAFGGSKLKYWIALGCAFGGICGFVPYFIRNKWGQTIVIDPHGKMLRIKHGDNEQRLAWSDIIGLQICHEQVPGNSELNGYQLNLAWKNSGGEVKRHCLLKHSIKPFIVALGKRYETLFGFGVVDHTRNSQ